MVNKIYLKYLWLFLFAALAVFFTGCHPGPRKEVMKFSPLIKLKPGEYPLFIDTMDFESLSASIDQSLEYFKKVPLERQYQYGKDIYTAAHMIDSLGTFKAYLEKNPSTMALNKFIASDFIVYKVAGNEDGNVLFTGYFEPTYEGKIIKSAKYLYPLYSKPDDLLEIDLSKFSDKYKGNKNLIARVNDSTKKVVPYYSREQINSIENFALRSEPLVWLKNRVDRFFLEIQGSGRIDLGQGKTLRVHYAGTNGNKYRSIGRYLIEKNEILKENMSMQAIRTWLEFHPKRMDEVLLQNKSFVFFRQEEGGPYGSLGVEVTGFRSIATDKKIFPKGALCFMQAELPDKINIDPLKEWEKASFFVLNQDTGGAIKGPARADLFCGNGSYARFTAGHMNKFGRLFFLVLKQGGK
ncbi:MAG: murein transglycosylase [Deltaproteobacteria bacterium]|nr:murein transglycosylase [Deltaproteobacteria bacterium]